MEEFYREYPLFPAWILPLIFYYTFSFQISIHLSISLSTYQFILLFDTFQSKLETSVHFPLSTSTWISLKFNSLLFFFGCKIYIQYAQVLSVYLLNFEKCMYLCNQTPVKIRTFTVIQESSSVPFPVDLYLYLPPPLLGNHCADFFPTID